MGLCKCPKKKVTNQFCFEHRVNVCEYCIVQNHPKCVVQSYLQWLQDSDYDPNCHFCGQELSEEECARLSCYHVFHWVCLDKWARSLPANTAPAGYACPICQECVFPADNLSLPVADALRRLLSNVNWARAGLGLPLLEERIERKPQFSDLLNGPRPAPEGESMSGQVSGSAVMMDDAAPSRLAKSTMAAASSSSTSDTIVQFDSTPTSRTSAAAPKAAAASPAWDVQHSDADLNENKYKRRSALSWITRYWRSMVGPRKRTMTRSQKLFAAAAVAILSLITLVVLMSVFGRSPEYMDPLLDPMNNPNIRVASER